MFIKTLTHHQFSFLKCYVVRSVSSGALLRNMIPLFHLALLSVYSTLSLSHQTKALPSRSFFEIKLLPFFSSAIKIYFLAGVHSRNQRALFIFSILIFLFSFLAKALNKEKLNGKPARENIIFKCI